MILQLNPPMPVETPHGEGMALFLIDYGMQWNTCYVVAIKSTRQLKHYESEQVRMGANFTFDYGEPYHHKCGQQK